MKILLNAYPRSGGTTFTSELRNAFDPFRSGNPHELAEFEEWITNKHEPFIFLGQYGNDVTLVSIIRDPIDAISSNTESWLRGFTGNIIQGVKVVNKKQNRIEDMSDLGAIELNFIKHQIEIYNSYLACLEKNINNIKCFTYDQTRNETEKCIKNIMIFSGIKTEKIINNKFTKTIIHKRKKHPIYFKIREYLESLDGISDGYNGIMEKVSEAQCSYPVKFNIP